MRLLRAFALGLILTSMGVLGSISIAYKLFGRTKCECGKIGGVGTHVGDNTSFIQGLRHTHGHADREMQFPGSFLLKSGSGERRRRMTYGWFLVHR